MKITVYALCSCFSSLYKMGPAKSTPIVLQRSVIRVETSGSFLFVGGVSGFS